MLQKSIISLFLAIILGLVACGPKQSTADRSTADSTTKESTVEEDKIEKVLVGLINSDSARLQIQDDAVKSMLQEALSDQIPHVKSKLAEQDSHEPAQSRWEGLRIHRSGSKYAYLTGVLAWADSASYRIGLELDFSAGGDSLFYQPDGTGKEVHVCHGLGAKACTFDKASDGKIIGCITGKSAGIGSTKQVCSHSVRVSVIQ